MCDETTSQTTAPAPWAPREHLPVETARELARLGAWEGRGLRQGDWVYYWSPILVMSVGHYNDYGERVELVNRAKILIREATLLPSLDDLLTAIRRQGWIYAIETGVPANNSVGVMVQRIKDDETVWLSGAMLHDAPTDLLAAAECLLAILGRKDGTR